MKMELPFAVVLIACGSLLWWSHAPAEDQLKFANSASANRTAAEELLDSQFSEQNRNSTRAPSTQFKTPSGPEFGASQQIRLATFAAQTPAPTDSNESRIRSTVLPNPKSDDSSRALIRQSASFIFNSPPLQSRIRMQIRTFGQSLLVDGLYSQQGQGTRRARFDFKYEDEDTKFQSMQMCDGQFFYSLNSMNDQSRLEFVNLANIAETNNKSLSFSAGPTGWLATGGVSSLLEHLAVAFDFQASESSQLGGVPMVSIRGQWNKKALEAMLMGQVNSKMFTPGPHGEVDWEKIPQQIPHTVEIMLGQDSFLKLFPYRIRFGQFQRETDKNRPDVYWQHSEMITLELFEVTKVADIPLTDFQINTEQLEPINATAKYVQRVKEFEHYQSVVERANLKVAGQGSGHQAGPRESKVPAVPAIPASARQ